MKQLSQTDNPLVLRTDFTDQAAWNAIYREIQKSVGIFRFYAHVEFIDDVQYTGITKEHVIELIPGHYNHSFIVLVDRTANSQSHHPLLIVDLYEKSGREFRALPSRIQSIENNLSIANMDFEEFAEAVVEDEVFRGFART